MIPCEARKTARNDEQNQPRKPGLGENRGLVFFYEKNGRFSDETFAVYPNTRDLSGSSLRFLSFFSG